MRPSVFAPPSPPIRRVAVIGGGISGMAAAYALSQTSDVTLFESEPRLGGHARTVNAGPGRDIPVDTGFMVFNRATYPNMTALFEELEVPVKPTDMSFGVTIDDGAFEYGLSDFSRMFADPRNAASPRFLRLLLDLVRFNTGALAAATDPEMTLDELLAQMGCGADFRDRYLYPLAGAIWSTARDDMGGFPAQSLVRFFENHLLLAIGKKHGWLTVDGGSIAYVERLERAMRRRGVKIRTAAPIEAAGRTPAPWIKAQGAERENFDAIVLACHSDQALRMLADPSPDEQKLLGAIRYRPNRVILHGDVRHMPKRRAAWSSWVYRGRTGVREITGSFSYWMNLLQGIDHSVPMFVTLNPAGEIDESLIYDEATFDHPQFDLDALRAQQRLPEIQGARRTWFAGAYTRHGFHEDGMTSGLEAARQIEAEAEPARQDTA